MTAKNSVAVLVSAQDHPASGKRVVPLGDRVALELALRTGLRVLCVHAGNSDEPALDDCRRMGAAEIVVLQTGPETDALRPILAHVRDIGPALILTGARSGHGHGSGMLPYLLATMLDVPILANVSAVSTTATGWQATA